MGGGEETWDAFIDENGFGITDSVGGIKHPIIMFEVWLLPLKREGMTNRVEMVLCINIYKYKVIEMLEEI